MGSSSRKKAEKARDFKKAKLRVGKTPRKPDNFTDTSFRSKAIVVSKQSLRSSAPSLAAQFAHHLSLLSHHASSTRRDSLAYLATHYPHTSAPPPPAALVPAVAPLVLDPSPAVRAELLKLLGVLPAQELRLHLHRIMLHVHSAMTHIDGSVRADSTRFLSWALGVGAEAVFANGGWARGLAALAGVLAFRGAAMASVPGAESKKTVRQHLEVLRKFLEAGLRADGDAGGGGNLNGDEGTGRTGLHWSFALHSLPKQSGAYAYLGLFAGGGRDAEEDPADVEARRRWRSSAGKQVVDGLQAGLVAVMKEGGETGRLAGRALALLERDMWDAPAGGNVALP